MKRKSLLLIALVVLTVAAWMPPASEACLFCNLTGYVNCESFTGTACAAEGTSRRCYINPPCACEWGVCRCSGGVWTCFW